MELISWVSMSLRHTTVMGFSGDGPWSLDVLIHMERTVGLWEGQTQSPREKKPHPGGITYIDVQCAQAETLLWALGGRVVSFPVYSIVSMRFCFFSTPLKDVKI